MDKTSAIDNHTAFARANATPLTSQTLSKFTQVFGETDGTNYFKAGMTFEQAATKHIGHLTGQWTKQVVELRDALSANRDLAKRVTALKTKLAAAEKTVTTLKASGANKGTVPKYRPDLSGLRAGQITRLLPRR